MTIPTLALALVGAACMAVAPAAAATHGCDAEAQAAGPGFTVGLFGGACSGAFIVLASDGCMMVEWGVHDGPVGVGGSSSCAIGVWANPSAGGVLP